MAKNNIFDVGDYLCLSAYFVVIICVGIYSSFAHRGSVSGFFLAEQKMSWFVVGTSLIASSIGTGHFIGLSGAAAKTGIGVSVFELHAVYGLVLLGWAFLPVYRTSGVITLPEYLGKRFGGDRIRYVLALLSLVLYVLTKISADLYAGAVFISEVIPSLSLYVSVAALVVISALFTITGGLTTVLWTDAIQTLIMIVGGSLLTALSLEKVGGYEEFKRKYSISIPDTIIANQDNNNYSYKHCGRPSEHFFKLIHPYDADTSFVPWTGLVFGLTVTTLWYFCADQVIVQRALSSSNMVQAKVACLVAAYFKFLPMWLMVIPGMVARILFTNTVTCNEPEECQGFCGNRNGCNLYAFPSLVLEILPSGLRGLLSSVILSALVTSLTSIFHSSATIFTLDLWSRIHRSASVPELMVMGRVSVLGLVIISIAWIPFVQKIDELFIYIQRITSYLTPPVTSVFLMTVFWKRTTEPAVFWGLTIGLVIGSIRFLWEEMYAVVQCGVEPSSTPSVLITKVHYLHFAAILFTIVTIFIVAVSCLTVPPPKSKYLGITFFSRYSPSVNPALLEENYTDRFQLGTQGDRASVLVKLTDGHPYEMQPWPFKVCMWMCGLDSLMIPSKAAKLRLMCTSIFEPQKLAKSLHLNAALALIIVSVYLAYFS